MIIGMINFSKFVEILSGSELFLLFSYLRASFIVLGVIFAKTKFSSVPCDKKSENCFSVPLIVFARSGPILAKKMLNPSDISMAPERTFPLLKNASGMLIVLRPLPSTLLIVSHVC